MNETRRSPAIDLERRVLDYIRTRCAPSPGTTVILAVSGGADSLCLLHILRRLSRQLELTLHVAHLDHMLRGDAAAQDAAFVVAQAEALGIDCTAESRNTRAYQSIQRCSLEEAARDVRYAFLRIVAVSKDAAAVMTGHTRDDAVETVMLHLVRGSGIHGLRGLEPVADYPLLSTGDSGRPPLRIVRPLLCVTRKEAQQYCRLRGLEFREDRSNESLDLLRNRIRLELLPSLRQVNPRFDDALLRLAEAAAQDDDHLLAVAQDIWNRSGKVSPTNVRIDLRQLVAAAPAVQARLVRHAVVHLVGSARDISSSHVASVRSLAAKSPGRQVHLPGGIVWRREETALVAFRHMADPAPEVVHAPSKPVPLAVPGETSIPEWRVAVRLTDRMGDDALDPRVAYLDADKVAAPLVVRRRRPGDRFRPMGMAEEKKVQDFMVDAKIPARLRDAVPIVTSPSHIVWVVGWRIDDRVKVAEETRRCLRLEFLPEPG